MTETSNKIGVLIVDDHLVVRQGIRFLLEQNDDIDIVGEASDGQEAVDLVQQHLPDIVLLDLIMSPMDGIEATRQIRKVSPTTQVIILTSHHKDDQIFQAIKSGALSYLLKDVSSRDLLAAIRAAARGETVLSPQVAQRVLREMQNKNASLLDQLTTRELDVLTRIAHGRSNREIAADLSIKDQTVKTHVSNILSKLHLADRTQAAIYALKQNLIPLDKAMNEGE
ncbi:Two-component transcriptional response regulator, LuxR family [hydrothermal vent metagenome]|uniref:Two-component transcriptional response regulator, LuxR family n=2 Tax=hydrothermal vent metagenome TaxID=652676 RepID=A0A3B0V6Z3_9ZZZZ